MTSKGFLKYFQGTPTSFTPFCTAVNNLTTFTYVTRLKFQISVSNLPKIDTLLRIEVNVVEVPKYPKQKLILGEALYLTSNVANATHEPVL